MVENWFEVVEDALGRWWFPSWEGRSAPRGNTEAVNFQALAPFVPLFPLFSMEGQKLQGQQVEPDGSVVVPFKRVQQEGTEGTGEQMQ
jgi:hypothetical protein